MGLLRFGNTACCSVIRRNSGAHKLAKGNCSDRKRTPYLPPPLNTVTMNQEKLQQLQAQVRMGGKGTARRKKKVVHRTATTDDKRLQSSLKKLSVNTIPGIEEVNMIKDDGSVIHFNNPKVQASLAANTFAVTGHADNKQITELLPGILNQLGPESLTHLKKLASNVTSSAAAAGGDDDDEKAGGNESGNDEDVDDDDDVPDLVGNFDDASKEEGVVVGDKDDNKENKED